MSLCDGVKVGPHTENGKNGKTPNVSDLTEILYVEQFLAATLKALVRFLKFCNFGPHKCKQMSKNGQTLVKKEISLIWMKFCMYNNFWSLHLKMMTIFEDLCHFDPPPKMAKRAQF